MDGGPHAVSEISSLGPHICRKTNKQTHIHTLTQDTITRALGYNYGVIYTGFSNKAVAQVIRHVGHIIHMATQHQTSLFEM